MTEPLTLAKGFRYQSDSHSLPTVYSSTLCYTGFVRQSR